MLVVGGSHLELDRQNYRSTFSVNPSSWNRDRSFGACTRMPTSVVGRRPFSHGPQGDGPDPFKVKESSDRVHRSEAITIGQPPSCIEWFRNDSRYFVIGTYRLLQGEAEEKAAETPSEPTKAQKRIGSIILCRLDSTLSTMYVVVRSKNADI